MNFKNSNANDTHGQKLDLSNKCDLKRSHKHIALSVRVLITHGETFKKLTKNKSRISASIWDMNVSCWMVIIQYQTTIAIFST